MKTLQRLHPLVIAVTLLAFTSCATFSNYQPLINGGISSGVAAGLLLIKSSSERATVANYIDVGAAALRTVTGTPTPQQLSDAIYAAIPANVKAQYPQIIALIVPLVISSYQMAYQQYGQNSAKLYAALNGIAVALETGVAPYIHPAPQT